MSQYLVHRDPRWWEEPEQFHPERWSNERQAERPKFSYFPFGGGGRVCIGEQFAWMEGVLVLATIAQRYNFCYEGLEPPGLEPLIALRPKNGVPMRVVER
jgi:cytochrome P450